MSDAVLRNLLFWFTLTDLKASFCLLVNTAKHVATKESNSSLRSWYRPKKNS